MAGHAMLVVACSWTLVTAFLKSETEIAHAKAPCQPYSCPDLERVILDRLAKILSQHSLNQQEQPGTTSSAEADRHMGVASTQGDACSRPRWCVCSLTASALGRARRNNTRLKLVAGHGFVLFCCPRVLVCVCPLFMNQPSSWRALQYA